MDIETRLAIVAHDVAEFREQLALTRSDAAAARTLAAGYWLQRVRRGRLWPAG